MIFSDHISEFKLQRVPFSAADPRWVYWQDDVVLRDYMTKNRQLDVATLLAAPYLDDATSTTLTAYQTSVQQLNGRLMTILDCQSVRSTVKYQKLRPAFDSLNDRFTELLNNMKSSLPKVLSRGTL